MSQPETRHLMKVKTTEDTYTVSTTGPVEQRAIPWCTTHDARYRSIDEACDDIEDYRLYTGEDLGCRKSTGGPDHKWWEDI